MFPIQPDEVNYYSSPNFRISPDDPEVPSSSHNFPLESPKTIQELEHEQEIYNIIQTPSPAGGKPATRKTPGPESSDDKEQIQIDNHYQILQALQNLRLSTENQQSTNTPPFVNRNSHNYFTEQYSLWGSPIVPNSNMMGFNQNRNSSTMFSSNFGNNNGNNIHSSQPLFQNLPQSHTNFNVHSTTESGNSQSNSNNIYGNNSNNQVTSFSSSRIQPNYNFHQNHDDNNNNFPPFPIPSRIDTSINIGQQQQYYHSQYQNTLSNIVGNNNSGNTIGFLSPNHLRTSSNPIMVPIDSKRDNIMRHRRQASTESPKQPNIMPSHKRSASTSSAPTTNISKSSSSSSIDDKDLQGRDLADSPTSNMKFKQFYRGFKQFEKEGYKEASSFAIENLETLPEKVHWRVYLELADLAKRENRIDEARNYYEQVNRLQPTAAQGWLEYAKMEEECGNLKECKNILSTGLSYCTVNESLMVKCLKHYERMNLLDEARALLGALKDVPVERTWRTIMEGGLLEARQGNTIVARQVFHYLISSVPWYGPIYQEACRFEEKCEEHDKAMEFVELGLQENPRYGPLWFSALRLNEKLSENGDVSSMHDTIERAVKSISKELVWKLYFEAAQIEERAGNIQSSRDFYVKSVTYCPENLLWKVWMGGARTELNFDNIDTARKLLKRALKEVPPKMKAMVLLECCRLEEYANEIDKAREILNKAKKYTKHEWKVFLESVLLEMRSNNMERAIQEAQKALLIHTGTGRLWAVMIQLKQSQGISAQMQVFRTALSEVPKSGEVWCEGARIALQQKDFVSARKYINFAIQFTPQYGDSFIEYLRLELLEKGKDNADLKSVEQACVNADPNYGALWLHCKQNPLDSTRNVVRQAITLLSEQSISDSNENPASVNLMVNDIYQNVHQRSNEERRKAIFL